MESSQSKKKILVLDKGTRVLNAVDELLWTGEWDLTVTFDPNSIYDLAKKQKPDLVIMDYLLIDNDCAVVCQDFKDDPELHTIPIIIVTAYKTKKTNEDSFKCDALFVKPLDFEVLASRMDYLMAS